VISFRPAIREHTPVLLGIAGPSRSGKTFSALRVATGLAQGAPIAMIDTESGRGLQYAEKFTYLYGELGPPFSSERYLEAIEAAKAQGARVIIVDSASHEHEGTGGMLEQHEAELTRLAGSDAKKRERMTFSAWVRPKAAHNSYVNRLLQMGTDTHFVFCFRAKDKLKIVAGAEPVHEGWTPICSSRFEYEMTSLLILPEGAQGRPDLSAKSSGLRDPFQNFVKEGIQLDEGLGQRLAKWAAGAKAAAPAAPAVYTSADGDTWPIVEPWSGAILQGAWNAATDGEEAYRTWWNAQGRSFRSGVAASETHRRFKLLAAAADKI
jgi:AAA domain